MPKRDRVYYFAVDVMRYFTNKYKKDWTPPEEPNALSPFTELTEKGIEAALKEWIYTGIQIYLRIAGTPYAKRFRCISRHIVATGIIARKDFLHVVTAVARTAIQFYVYGQHEAPTIAIDVIARVLRRYQKLHGTDIFLRFNQDFADLAAADSNN